MRPRPVAWEENERIPDHRSPGIGLIWVDGGHANVAIPASIGSSTKLGIRPATISAVTTAELPRPVPPLVSYPGPDQVVRHEIMARICAW